MASESVEPASCSGAPKPKRCFYCNCKVFPHPFVEGVPHADDLETVDHVIPRMLMRQRYELTKKQMRLNRVAACHVCNNHKGGRDPIDYLTSPNLSDSGANRLRDLLYDLGIPEHRIERACVQRMRGLAGRRRA